MSDYIFLFNRRRFADGDFATPHFDEQTANEAISHIVFTDKAGKAHEGLAHWTVEQVEAATSAMTFPAGTTKWDKYVAFNFFYADTCKALDDADVIKAAFAFFFADEDASDGKVYRYVRAMQD